MPEFSEILAATWKAAGDVVTADEGAHLLAQVKAIRQLESSEDPLTALEKLLTDGWTPDYFAGNEMTVDASLVMTTSRERTAGGGGSAALGPLQLNATFANTYRQATQTNVSVQYRGVRQSRSQGLEYALQSLGLVRT